MSNPLEKRMSAEKHTLTAITWAVQQFPDSRHCRINPTGDMAECGAIADVYHSLENAYLIAAAPVMLEALKAALEFGEEVERQHLEGMEGCFWPVEQIRAALEAARGEK